MSDPFMAPGAPTSSTPGQSTDDYIRAHFGFEAWALDVPELRQVLEDATTNGWDQNRIDGAIQATTWFKTHTAHERQYQGDLANDPAGMAATIAQMGTNISAMAAKSGVTITPDRLSQMATNAVREGWDNTQLQAAVGYEFNYTGATQIPAHMVNGQLVDNVTGRAAYYGPNGEPGGPTPGPGLQPYTMEDGRVAYYKPGNTAYGDSLRPNAVLSTPGQGQAGATGPAQPNQIVDQLKQLAQSYLIPLSDQTIQQWAQQIISGSTDINGFTSYAKEQAKSLYPGLGAAIDAGTTTAQYADTYKQRAAQLLEISPDSINMSDPKWETALNQIDPKTGQRVSMSLTDWTNEMRTNPVYGYSKTTQARDQAYGVTQELAQTLGAIA